jgi:Xaa-Pro dipeptidase
VQLPFSLATYAERTARVQARLEREGLDAVLVSMPDNLNWLTGYDTIGYLWFQLLVVPARGEPVFVTRTMEAAGVEGTSCLIDARYYDIVTQDPVAVAVDLLRERGLAEARLGVELWSFTLLPAQWDALRAALPAAELRDASQVVAEERIVKTPEELAYQRRAAQMADRALLETVEALRPGISETELAGIASLALGEAGSEYAAIPPLVVSGERTPMMHALATGRTINAGDVVLIELAGVTARYHAVVMRTAVVGRPSPRVRAVADCLEEAMAAAIEACIPGADAPAPDRAANAVLARLDLVRRRAHRIGYSLGVAYPPTWLEPMVLAEGDPHRLQPGMSFTLEPNLYLPDEGFGMKLGETVTVTTDGPESLTSLGHGLIVVA